MKRVYSMLLNLMQLYVYLSCSSKGFVFLVVLSSTSHLSIVSRLLMQARNTPMCLKILFRT